jgi:hypothetical protein
MHCGKLLEIDVWSIQCEILWLHFIGKITLNIDIMPIRMILIQENPLKNKKNFH